MSNKRTIDRTRAAFTTSEGVTITIKRLPIGVVMQIETEYSRISPKPKPRPIVLENGQEWADLNDEYYKQQLADWQTNQMLHYSDRLFEVSILDEPPADWEPLIDVGKPRKVAWVLEQLYDAEDLYGLINAICGTSTVTNDGIKEAEKN